MGNPQQAEEPTMEEILASIRRIIADDEETGDAPAQQAVDPEAVDPEAVDPEAGDPEAGKESDQDARMEAQGESHANDDDESDAPPDEMEEPAAQETADADMEDPEDDVFELSEVVEEEPAAEPEMAADAETDIFDVSALEDEPALEDDIAFDDPPEAVPEPEPVVASQPAPPAGEGLLSDEAQSTASAAFGMLASSMLSHSGGARTLEGIVEDLLRPLLKAWLDENLPPMVEQIVREEIERVARRR